MEAPGPWRTGAPDDDAAGALAASRRYLTDFDGAVGAGADAADVVRAMTAAHGDRGNPYTLFLSAAAQYPEPAGADGTR
ncbi:hypothetical protein ACIBAI_17435 [Streptomyces sp. NPDC051041]|uniref:hypothetical protein n=1 Tax=Streptomyces sp. NPDC051041 TaxID=3365640 RepID=UPI00379D9AE3